MIEMRIVLSEIGDRDPLLLESLARVQHRAGLDGGGDDVIALFPVHLDHALEGEVVRLGAARGEDQLLRIAGTDQSRYLLPPAVHRRLRLPPEGVVAATRVPELLREVGQHRLDHPRIHRGGGVRVHEDGELHRH
jgi:hypothetical protein